ncbi:hypothetical protein [Bacillus cereus]|uniref:Phage protein n=1 Tax=Bacillus cereus TIAC219 TaxID=718222 RepID=A0ABC9SQH6_BACCE|nr:hypothetical protein [Bacillus cereus]EJP81136.1 hypothetical protein IC1_06624 [Bacillus cereus VD022]EOQ57835.1 hypothetical protein IAY_06251 [Bacillus cereus TIAC219]
MFKTGDKARLKISFEMVERGHDYTFDDHADVERFVRGDMVEILRIIDNKADKRKHEKLAVIYNPKTFASTTLALYHLEPIKGEININVPVKVEGAKEAATKICEALKSVKIEVGDPKKIVKGELGGEGMKITATTISAKNINITGSHLHTGGMIHGDKKLSF